MSDPLTSVPDPDSLLDVEEVDDQLEVQAGDWEPGRDTTIPSDTARARITKNIEALVDALVTARIAKPRDDHFTAARLAKHGAPDARTIRRTIRDHRYAVWAALKARPEPKTFPRWRRAPYYDCGAVFI